MSILALIAICGSPIGMTWEDIERNKYEEYRRLDGYHEVMKAGSVRVEKKISKNKLWMLVSEDSLAKFESGWDGKSAFVVQHEGQFYCEYPGLDPFFHAANFALPQVEPGNFNLHFQGYGFTLPIAPVPKVEQPKDVTVDGKRFRYFKATVKSPSTGNVLTIEQWLLPDKWIVDKIVVGGLPEMQSVVFETISRSFGEKLTDKDFQLDASKLKGYERSNPPPPPAT